ncbi:glycine cleavage system aminomethyltransferase GcvT [Paenibacillus sp. MER TA 81-3]|uniref:glycine cleavage system aminomethyltransferase GcvT n=1 Tax=Paenibacillus sp. MER TA 81-3 TaxID=2939573 RepID=UPI002040B3B6|nr:glycine cleavage system aminomethyltransferase GcvT [Paenibacillus sp. MER TA 81-3]MCM3342174.1 glycine cleavage system aminomethyltransferase GcvT [Paenibacillus sp. MER TA 81-3]
MSQLKRTPIFPLYADYPGARCIDFGGWELPVQFSGIQKEHEAVRTQAGLFDVSHMGEFIVSGSSAEAFLQHVTTNDVTRLVDGRAQYSLLCNPNGGVVDDILIYRLAANHYMLVVNASNIDKDFAWLQEHLPADVVLENKSDSTALLALQGPNAQAIAAHVTDAPLAELKPFQFVRDAAVCGVRALISRTGYTGEDGFELYVAAEDAPQVWTELMRAGEAHGLVPAGLGARDTLRFEAKLPLYGQEISADISPLEAGLGFFVKLDKGDFIGREALASQKADGPRRKLVGIEMIDKGIPRSHYPVLINENPVGEVTTGTKSPTLKRNLGLALIDAAYSELDTEVMVEIRGKQLKARVIKAPFYKRATN